MVNKQVKKYLSVYYACCRLLPCRFLLAIILVVVQVFAGCRAKKNQYSVAKKIPQPSLVSSEKKWPKEDITLDYIDKFWLVAVNEMNLYHIPASVTLAQGILESGSGQGALAIKGNNHFGIKCHKNWNGPIMHHDDDKKNDCFRLYKTPVDAYRAHSEFLANRNRYRFLFDYKLNDYVAWAKGLKKAGYATDTQYAKKLIAIIERYKLYEFDKKYANKKKKKVMDFVTKKKPGVHIVRQGETLYSIAKKYGVSIERIAKRNKLKQITLIYVGQQLIIPAKE